MRCLDTNSHVVVLVAMRYEWKKNSEITRNPAMVRVSMSKSPGLNLLLKEIKEI